MKTPNLGERSDLRQKYGASMKKAETLYLIGRYCKDHPYYSFLRSKSLGPLARVTEKYLENSKKSSSVSKNKVFDTVPVLYSDNKAGIVQLIFDKAKKIELSNISQYIIDYETNPVIFIFNAKYSEGGMTLPGQFSNFQLSLELEETPYRFDIVDDNVIEFKITKKENFVKDAGIYKHDNIVFQVYGTKISEDDAEKIDSNKIFCYDCSGKGEYYPLQLKTPQEILPRHSVTTCAFTKGKKIYLYVFGGQAQPNILYKNRVLDRLPIIDIVEVYETTLPLTSSSEWDYSMIPKEKIYDAKNISFIPYLQSYAHYIEEKDQILIMGGSLFKDSVYEWTFPIFEFSVSQKQFTAFDIVLNNARAHSTKKAVKNNLYSRPVITLPIADKNRNVRINQDKKEFEFLIPCDDDNRVFLYSFQYITKKCEYHEFQHKSEKTEEKASNQAVQSAAPYKIVPFPMRLGAQLQYFLINSQECNQLLSKLVSWRISLGKDLVSDTTINENVQEIKESIEKEISEIITDESVKRTKISQVNNILKFFERKDFLEVFMSTDSRIFVLKEQLLKKSQDASEEKQISYIFQKQSSISGEKNLAFIQFELKVLCLKLLVFIQNSGDLTWKYLIQQKKDLVDKVIDVTNDTINHTINVVSGRLNEQELVKKFDELFVKLGLSGKEVNSKPTISTIKSIQQSKELSMIFQNDQEFSKSLDSAGTSISTSTAPTASTSSDNFEKSNFKLAPSEVINQLEGLAIITKRIDDEFVERLSVDNLLKAQLEALKSLKDIFKKRDWAERIDVYKQIVQESFLGPLKNLMDKMQEICRVTNQNILSESLLGDKNVSKADYPDRAEEISIERERVKEYIKDDTEETVKRESKDAEIQTNLSLFPECELIEEEEKKIDDVHAFKGCITSKETYRMFFNGSKSELIIVSAEGTSEKVYSYERLRFKVTIEDQENQINILEDISFEYTPFSIWVYRNCVICYIDQTFKVRYPEVYSVYKNWVLYADIGSQVERLRKSEEKVGNLVFRKLFLVTQDDKIIQRCLFANEDVLFLFGGNSYNFKRNKVVNHQEVLMYDLRKMVKSNQNSSEFRDSDVDKMENIKGECMAVSNGKLIFVCKRLGPTKMEVFDRDGVIKEDIEIELPKSFKDTPIGMNLVNFRDKEEILFTQYKKDKNLEFALYDIKNDCFEEKSVKLVPRALEEDDKKFQMLYSGFEEIEINTSTDPITGEILLYIVRDDIPRILACKIDVT